MSITNQQAGQFPTGGAAPSFTDLAELNSAEITFGYANDNVTEGQAAVEHNNAKRPGPIGWWNRHKSMTAGIAFVVASNMAFLPMVQNAALTALGSL